MPSFHLDVRVIRHVASRDENFISFRPYDLGSARLRDYQVVDLELPNGAILRGRVRSNSNHWFAPAEFGSYRTVTDTLRAAGIEAGAWIRVRVTPIHNANNTPPEAA